ncbi:two-component sensor histidine kinase [Sphaerisporangium rufum]|uniref:histidine kinase n=1 Tax=Sphaerisporangium rufum TaxID=1381558 RepID=A0A919UZ50_9ACTN|nr:sensor histidine kinase [Sphaerisporangium rufum]GII78731.1 two-component sensor histidine kinase [Sphaerisporangium rufum]
MRFRGIRPGRPLLTGRDRRVTLLAATGVAVSCAAVQIIVFAGDGPLPELALNLLLDACLPLVVRLPRTVGTLAVAVTALLALAGGPAPPAAASLVVSFLVYVLPWRQAFAFAAVLAIPAIPLWAPSWPRVYVALSATALPALVALYLRTRVELLRALHRRAELADAERRLLAERAETAERRRLAAELHDIVTHHVTEIVLHADALRVTTADAEARAAAEHIRRAGTRTLTELGDLMRVVTTGARPVPAPRAGYHTDDDTGGDLSALAAADGAELAVRGDPATVPAVVARAVYRVVQESLTNARKHAPGAPVTVAVAYPGGRAEVEVRNDRPARGPDPALAGSGSGMGLAGLHRRVTLLGGTFHAGPDGTGGFAVRATVPAGGAAQDGGGPGAG